MAESCSDENLKTLYRKALLQVLSLDQLGFETSSHQYQKVVQETIDRFEQATQLINALQLFSSNERAEDVQTSHLKYFLTPAFLGFLTSRLTGADRLQIVTLSSVYFHDFLKRLYEYQLISTPPPEVEEQDASENNIVASQPTLEDMAVERGEKIRKFNENQKLDEDLDKLAYILKDDQEDLLDDEVIRNYYVTLIRRWVNIAQDELKSLKLEKQMLTMFAGKSMDDLRKDRKTNERFKPFIITKNELQKQVFGLGYPSRPTVTIEEFVNSKIDDGSLSVAPKGHSLETWAADPDAKREDDEQDDVKKEILTDRDDEVHLIRERNWDEWKDEHRRGEGNRLNMG